MTNTLNANATRKLAEIAAAGPAGLTVKSGWTVSLRDLVAAGLVTVERVGEWQSKRYGAMPILRAVAV